MRFLAKTITTSWVVIALLASVSTAQAQESEWSVIKTAHIDYDVGLAIGAFGVYEGETVVATGPFGAAVYDVVGGNGRLDHRMNLRPLEGADEVVNIFVDVHEDLLVLGIDYGTERDPVIQIYDRPGDPGDWTLIHTESIPEYLGYRPRLWGVHFDEGRLLLSLDTFLDDGSERVFGWISIRERDGNGAWPQSATLPEDPFASMYADFRFGEYLSAHEGTLLATIPGYEANPDSAQIYAYNMGGYALEKVFDTQSPENDLFGIDSDINDDFVALIHPGVGIYAMPRSGGSVGELSAVSADSLFDVDHTPHYTVALGGMGQQGWLAATVELTPASGFGYTEVVVFQYSGSTLTPKLTIGSQDPSGDANFFGTVLDWSGDTLMVCSPESTAPDEAKPDPTSFGDKNGACSLYDCSKNCERRGAGVFGGSPDSRNFGGTIASSNGALFLLQQTGKRDEAAVIHTLAAPSALDDARISFIETTGRIAAPDNIRPNNDLEKDARFGEVFDVDGSLLAVRGYDGGRPAVFVYTRTDSGDAWELDSTINAANTGAGDSERFGEGILVEGEAIYIGDPRGGVESSIFRMVRGDSPNVWKVDDTIQAPSERGEFGRRMAFLQGTLYAAQVEDKWGEVHAYAAETSSPQTLAPVQTPSLLNEALGFGANVVASAGWVAVADFNTRSVHLYRESQGGLLQPVQIITKEAVDSFGASIAISNDRLLIAGVNHASAWFLDETDENATWREFENANLLAASGVRSRGSTPRVGLVGELLVLTLPDATYNHFESGRAMFFELGEVVDEPGNNLANNATPINATTPAVNNASANNTTPDNNSTPGNNSTPPGNPRDVPSELTDYGCAMAPPEAPRPTAPLGVVFFLGWCRARRSKRSADPHTHR